MRDDFLSIQFIPQLIINNLQIFIQSIHPAHDSLFCFIHLFDMHVNNKSHRWSEHEERFALTILVELLELEIVNWSQYFVHSTFNGLCTPARSALLGLSYPRCREFDLGCLSFWSFYRDRALCAIFISEKNLKKNGFFWCPIRFTPKAHHQNYSYSDLADRLRPDIFRKIFQPVSYTVTNC